MINGFGYLSISNTPVREALSLLKAEGFGSVSNILFLAIRYCRSFFPIRLSAGIQQIDFFGFFGENGAELFRIQHADLGAEGE